MSSSPEEMITNERIICHSGAGEENISEKTRNELLMLCKDKGLRGYSSKKKDELIELLEGKHVSKIQEESSIEKIYRLNYIGSKHQLLDWIVSFMKKCTEWDSFEEKTIGDMCSGTGIVSYYFRKQSARVISNDAELYSSIITHAFTLSIYTEKCKEIICMLQEKIDKREFIDTIGFITTYYSPYNGNERKFFTIDNAKIIDFIWNELRLMKESLSFDEYQFLLASLLLSADAVSNVPAVYGCFLKEFKAKAVKTLIFCPIHTNEKPPLEGSQTFQSDILNKDFLLKNKYDLVYLDPPYNERQYSKNYFPLNMIANPHTEIPLKGKTGIPSDCFISPFCRKGDLVKTAFDSFFAGIQAEWIFVSYNSESLLTKEEMISIMEKYGVVSMIERDYKRFKSFEYNEDKKIKEYLFCLHKSL
jgi:adenine-specific DNA-methyltransferase